MRPRSQAAYREIGMLRSLRLEIRVEVLDEDAVQGYAGDSALGPASADPTDRGPGKGKARLRARRRRRPSGSGAPRPERSALSPTRGDSGDHRDNRVVLNPTGAVGDRRIRFLQARDRRGG